MVFNFISDPIQYEPAFLLIVCWALFFYISQRYQRMLIIVPFIITIFMFQVMGWVAILFFAVSLYFMLDYLISFF
jgi:hypothetical protein